MVRNGREKTRNCNRVPAGYASPEAEKKHYSRSCKDSEDGLGRRESAALSVFYRKRFGSQSPESYRNLRISQIDKVLTKENIRDILEEVLKDMAPFEIKIVNNPEDEQRLAYVNFKYARSAKNVRRHLIDRLQKEMGQRLMIDPAGIVRDQDGKYVPDRYNRDHDRRCAANEHLSPIRSRDAFRLGGAIIRPPTYRGGNSTRYAGKYPRQRRNSWKGRYHQNIQRQESISPDRDNYAKTGKKVEQKLSKRSHSMTHSDEDSHPRKHNPSHSPNSISESSDGSVFSESSLRSVSRSPSPVNQVHTREQLMEEVASTWKGLLNFKRFPYPICLHRIFGKEYLLQDILRDEIGNSLPLVVDKHFQVDIKFYDRIVAFKQHEIAVMLAVDCKNTSLRPIIDYLKLKKAAGVISLEGGTLYVLTYSQLAEKMLKFFAPRMAPLFGPNSDHLLMLLRKTVIPVAVIGEPSTKYIQPPSKAKPVAKEEVTRSPGEIKENEEVNQPQEEIKENIDGLKKEGRKSVDN